MPLYLNASLFNHTSPKKDMWSKCEERTQAQRHLYLLHHYCNLQGDFLMPPLLCSGSVEIKGKSIRMGVQEQQKESLIRTRIRMISTWRVYLHWKLPPYQRRSPLFLRNVNLQLVQREKVEQQLRSMKYSLRIIKRNDKIMISALY